MKTKSRRKLKRVIAVRHGTDSERDLDENGIERMQQLARAIKKRFVKAKQRVEIFSSPYPRATQSAEILAQHLGCSYSVCEVLRYDEFSDGAEMMNALLKARNGSDVIIAVTHYESPSGIVDAFSCRFFQQGAFRRVSEKGDGCTLCMKTGAVEQTLLD